MTASELARPTRLQWLVLEDAMRRGMLREIGDCEKMTETWAQAVAECERRSWMIVSRIGPGFILLPEDQLRVVVTADGIAAFEAGALDLATGGMTA